MLSKISHFLWNEYIFFAWPMDPWKSQFKGPKYIISKSSFVRKRKMWCYRSSVVGHGSQKRKKQICGTEEEIVVAHGRLPPPLHGQELGNEQERLHEYLLMNSLNKNLFMNSLNKNLFMNSLTKTCSWTPWTRTCSWTHAWKRTCVYNVNCTLYNVHCTMNTTVYTVYRLHEMMHKGNE